MIKENENNEMEVLQAPVGKIFKDWFEDGVRCLIMRGPSSLCAYLGVPENHPLAGFHYDDIPLDCHCGLTFSGDGKKGMRPPGFYWYGWDYSHSGDASTYDFDPRMLSISPPRKGDKLWTVPEVEEQIKSTLYDFKKLVALAEKVKSK